MISPSDTKNAPAAQPQQNIPTYAEALAASTSSPSTHVDPSRLEAQPPQLSAAPAQQAPNVVYLVSPQQPDASANKRARRRFLAAFFYAGLWWVLITMLAAGTTGAAMYEGGEDGFWWMPWVVLTSWVRR